MGQLIDHIKQRTHALDDLIANYRKEEAEAQRRVASLQTTLEKTTQESREKSRALTDTRTKLSSLYEQLAKVQQSIAEAEQRQNDLTGDLEAVRHRRTQAEREYGEANAVMKKIAEGVEKTREQVVPARRMAFTDYLAALERQGADVIAQGGREAEAQKALGELRMAERKNRQVADLMASREYLAKAVQDAPVEALKQTLGQQLGKIEDEIARSWPGALEAMRATPKVGDWRFYDYLYYRRQNGTIAVYLPVTKVTWDQLSESLQEYSPAAQFAVLVAAALPAGDLSLNDDGRAVLVMASLEDPAKVKIEVHLPDGQIGAFELADLDQVAQEVA